MTQRSLTRRAMALVLITEIVCALAFSLTSLWHERRTRLHGLDEMLRGRSDSLLGAIQDAEDPQDNVAVDPEELKLPAQDVWAVYSQDGRQIGHSAAGPLALVAPRGDGTYTTRADGKGFRVMQSRGLRIIDRNENGGVGLRRPVTIVYATPTRRMVHEIREAAVFYVGLSFALVLVTALILIVSFRRMFKPLEELATKAAGVGTRSDSFTPPESALAIRELRPLATALSESIGRLRSALDMQHRFISDAAHELKTSVAVVRSSVQLLTMRQRSSTEYIRGLDRVLEDNQRVEQLVARMLTLGRLEEQHATAGATTDVTESVSRTLQNLEPWVETRQVNISRQTVHPAVVPLSQESADVLVSNLVMNAVQHSRPGTEVLVRVAQEHTTVPEILFEVQDCGGGIPAESLPHVFERFYRDDRSRSRETGGAGLGLAICKSIVEGARGSIQIESAVGQGTIVSVRLRAQSLPSDPA